MEVRHGLHIQPLRAGKSGGSREMKVTEEKPRLSVYLGFSRQQSEKSQEKACGLQPWRKAGTSGAKGRDVPSSARHAPPSRASPGPPNREGSS